ncbi:hypothetical protein QBC44DRAFT_317761 [Cladorrhinum sp. PSN332]|nr:hypothetical protein QBC44DRAFT_317761 [Cladorrhinum sp. PSN332]
MSATHTTPTSHVYFGYGSNLWIDQMSRRCPSSPFTGLGLLRGYKWFINSRGYANIAPSNKAGDEVWGLVYNLTAADEARLDVNEGVPVAYEKRVIPVLFRPKGKSDLGGLHVERAGAAAVSVHMLVYIDFKRNVGGYEPRAEYVHRMNMGIRDALREGVPDWYVDKVLREYIPPEDEARLAGGEEVMRLAMRQAILFRDESGVITPQNGGSGDE